MLAVEESPPKNDADEEGNRLVPVARKILFGDAMVPRL